jgi:hypothetical protein
MESQIDCSAAAGEATYTAENQETLNATSLLCIAQKVDLLSVGCELRPSFHGAQKRDLEDPGQILLDVMRKRGLGIGASREGSSLADSTFFSFSADPLVSGAPPVKYFLVDKLYI